MKYKISDWTPPSWNKENQIIYFVGSCGFFDENSAITMSSITGKEIEVFIPDFKQFDLFKDL